MDAEEIVKKLFEKNEELSEVVDKNIESVTPEVVHSWQHSIESIVDGIKEVATEYFDLQEKQAHRYERLENTKMTYEFITFKHRFWASLIIAIICLAALIALSILNVAANLIPLLAVTLGGAIGYLTANASFIGMNNGKKESSDKKE